MPDHRVFMEKAEKIHRAMFAINPPPPRPIDLVATAYIERLGVNPLYLAAEATARLAPRRCKPVIATGFRVPPSGRYETDGPPGAVAAARLYNMLGWRPVIVVEEGFASLMEALIKAAGVDAQIVEVAPASTMAATAAARELVAGDTCILLVIEKPGLNVAGVRHSMRGLDVTMLHCDVEAFIERARRHGVYVVAVGDGGNEAGLGNVEELVRRYIPYGDICACPCRRGIAAHASSDAVVIGPVSNLATYGYVGLVAAMTGVPAAVTCSLDRRLREVMVEVGGVDGVTGRREATVDGYGDGALCRVIESVNRVVAN